MTKHMLTTLPIAFRTVHASSRCSSSPLYQLYALRSDHLFGPNAMDVRNIPKDRTHSDGSETLDLEFSL